MLLLSEIDHLVEIHILLQKLLTYLLKQHKGNKNIVCQLLGISKATLATKQVDYLIEEQE